MESGRRPLSTEELAFYRAIWEAPDDDAPRLIFADWLDDNDPNGESALAAFIRHSIEIYHASTFRHSIEIYHASTFRQSLQDKHNDLLAKAYNTLVRKDSSNLAEGALTLFEYGNAEPCEPVTSSNLHVIGIVKGLVRYVYCPLSVWRSNYGPQIAHHPVELRIIDRIPYRAVDRSTDIGRRVFWTFSQLGYNHSSNLPITLRPFLLSVNLHIEGGIARPHAQPLEHMLGYSSPSRALKALGEALVLEARDQHVFTHPMFSQSSPTPDTESAPA